MNGTQEFWRHWTFVCFATVFRTKEMNGIIFSSQTIDLPPRLLVKELYLINRNLSWSRADFSLYSKNVIGYPLVFKLNNLSLFCCVFVDLFSIYPTEISDVVYCLMRNFCRKASCFFFPNSQLLIHLDYFKHQERFV